MKRGEGIVGAVVESGEPLVINDVSKDPRFYKNVDDDTGFQTRSILCVPLHTVNRLWGAIEVLNKLDGGEFDDDDLALCEAVAGQAAIAIENAMLHREMLKQERMAAIGQTIAGLAHCIKNVLNGIRGGSYMVDLGLRGDKQDRVVKGWEIVKKNSTFMEDLVLDMLTYSKEREPEYAAVDPNEGVEAVCDLMTAKANEKGVTIAWTPCPELKQVTIDPKGIRRCVLNLVSNAVDACSSEDEARVAVSIEVVEGGMFHINVSDNGCGISQEDKAKLFQMFFSTKGSKGTGLGLAVTHKIIVEHKGKILVDSELGKGTTFTIVLPCERPG